MKPNREYLPMFVGTLVLTVLDGEKRIVHRIKRKNTIQTGILGGAPYQVGIDNSASCVISLRGIDYSMTSGVSSWEQGTVPTQSAGGDMTGGDFNETYVTHTNSYTAAAAKTIRRLRMRRKPLAFGVNEMPNEGNDVLSMITGLNITLQTTWQLETTWTLAVL